MGIFHFEVSQQVLNLLRHSNLNFKIVETPYTAEILLRKKFVKEASGPAAFELFSNVLVNQEFREQNIENQKDFMLNENSNLKNRIEELKSLNKKSDDTIAVLNEKLSKAEANSQK